MGLVTSKNERDVGVVYLDTQRQALPATHALVIGVGQYATEKLSAVSSPSVAARMMAEWFPTGCAGKPRRFDNPGKPPARLASCCQASGRAPLQFADEDASGDFRQRERECCGLNARCHRELFR
jgi:hypothetical protein